MEYECLSAEERAVLLKLARQSIEYAASGRVMPPVDLETLPPRLREEGVCLVTLTENDGQLRGCIGGLEARLPLALDVCEHAAAAATEDFRFSPVRPAEVPRLHIEISRLTPPQPREYETPVDLLAMLQRGVDGVVLHDGYHRATFLPQVWEKLPDPSRFLSQLCEKMGAPADLWRRKKLQVETYQVEEFHEL
ncbi:MAG TPA: AmmeMemoRadiSam system protein A [Anaerolineaceae bacterium]